MRLPASALRPTAALRRLGARLAFVALLAGALMPGVARLLQPAAGPAAWASICQSAPSDSPQGGTHDHEDACAFCTLAHTTPVLAGAAVPAVAVVAYAPPAPPATVPVREGVTQARAASARAPPALA